MSDLEYRLGAVLFERTNSGTYPTVIGREFLETAHKFFEEIDCAVVRLKSQSRGECGKLTIGVYASLSTGNLRATLTEYHRRLPEVAIQTVDGAHDGLLCNLATNTIDIAIMTASSLGWDDRLLPLWNERVIVALPAQHPLSARNTVSWSDLSNEPVLLPRRGPGAELERLLTGKLHYFNSRRIRFHDVGLDRLLSLVGAGCGVLLMLEGATGMRCDSVVYREIRDCEGPTRLNFTAYWREANSNPTLGPFLDMLRERYPDLSAPPAPG